MKRIDKDFTSRGLKCAAWLYLPDGDEKPPVIVMAHGFAAERSFRLPAYAERFAAAGMAVLLFDYRNFGDSAGSPRNLVDPERHVEDWRAAIAHVRELPEVDPDRIALWGTSFSGGHVITTAAVDHKVKAIVAQVPYVGGGEVNLPRSMQIRVGAFILLDRIAALFGSSVTIPAIGSPDRFGCLMAQEATEYSKLVPHGSTWRNAVPARVLLTLAGYQPRDVADQVTCPALFIVGERDETTPADLAVDCAGRIQQAEVISYDCGHFAPYLGETFETVVSEQTAFFGRHLGVS